MTKYVPIDTSPRRQFEEDATGSLPQDEEFEIALDNIDTDLDDAEEELAAAAAAKVDKPKKPEAKKPHRSQKRIMQLANEKRELAELLEAERQKNAELQRTTVATVKTSKQGTKAALEAKIVSLSARLKQAMVEGDTDQTIELNDELLNTKMELAVLAAEISNIQEPEAAPRAPSKAQPQVSRKALAWVEAHPAFKTDPVFYGAAMATNNRLMQEGFDPDSDDFYDELNERLAPKFPEVFGDLPQDDVESEEDTDSSDFDGEELPDVKPVSKKPSPKQTVSASARPTGKGATPPRKSEKVTLTQDELAQAHRMGISPEKYALRKMHMAKNKRADGYTPIFIPTH